MIVAFVGWILGSTYAQPSIIGWLHDWQDLTAGIIAFVGATIGAIFLYQQIVQTREIEAQRRASKFIAVRSVLPWTLSELRGYVMSEMQILRKARSNGASLPTNLADLPSETVEVLKEFIEHTEDHDAGVTVREMLADIQFHRKSMQRHAPRQGRQKILTATLLTNIVRLKRIYVRIIKLSDYARFETKRLHARVTRENMQSAARILPVHSNNAVMK
jgi:hypothetical protein